MEKKHIIAGIILIIIIGLGFIILNIDKSDMLNTEKILVTEASTGDIYEIDDKKIIKKIVKQVIKKETSGLDIDLDGGHTYSLEFFTREFGYGPLLCFKQLGICIFEEETQGNFIEVDESFFEAIEKGISGV